MIVYLRNLRELVEKKSNRVWLGRIIVDIGLVYFFYGYLKRFCFLVFWYLLYG